MCDVRDFVRGAQFLVRAAHHVTRSASCYASRTVSRAAHKVTRHVQGRALGSAPGHSPRRAPPLPLALVPPLRIFYRVHTRCGADAGRIFAHLLHGRNTENILRKIEH